MSQWIELQGPTCKALTKPFKFNNIEYISVPITYLNPKGIQKYNVEQNKWSTIIEYPFDFECHGPTSVLSDDSKSIYIHSQDSLIRADLATKSLNSFMNLSEIRDFPAIFIINDKFHRIGGIRMNSGSSRPITHEILNETKGTFEIAKVLKLDHKAFDCFACFDLVYLESQQEILIFTDPAFLYRYSLANFTLNKIVMNKSKPFTDHCAMIITAKYDYVIMFGVGYVKDEEADDAIQRTNEIWIFDMNEHAFKLSEVVIPIKKFGFVDAISMNDESMDKMLTFGYIRRNTDFFPDYLVDMICGFVLFETVYVYSRTQHWKIDVDHLLHCVHTK